jgi:hypothetical protein
MGHELKSISLAMMIGLLVVMLPLSSSIPGLNPSAKTSRVQDPQSVQSKVTAPVPDLIVAVRQGNTARVKSLLMEGG